MTEFIVIHFARYETAIELALVVCFWTAITSLSALLLISIWRNLR